MWTIYPTAANEYIEIVNTNNLYTITWSHRIPLVILVIINAQITGECQKFTRILKAEMKRKINRDENDDNKALNENKILYFGQPHAVSNTNIIFSEFRFLSNLIITDIKIQILCMHKHIVHN